MKVKIIFEVLFLSVIFSKVVLADSASYVYTPNGSAVSTMTMTYELSAAEINFKIALVQQDFPNATILAYPSRKYNCHSYAWYWQSTSNDRWMNTPGDDTYWLAGSYYNVYYQVSGDKVSYASDDHSGIFDGNNYVISKWGNSCLVRHLSYNCPYNSLVLRYYRR